MSLVDIGVLSLVEIVGDFGLKKFANEGGAKNLAMGITGYVGVIYFLIQALQGSTVLAVNAGWDGMSALIESIAAYVILGERFKNTSEFFGIGFIILGLFLMDLPMYKKRAFVWPSMN
jgi:multidrug transporter EmrE-like cation transporter